MVRKAMDEGRVAEEKARILLQAQGLVEQKGFKDLSMRKLASELGITATTIYRYFTSKDELFLSLLVVGFKRLRDMMTAAVAQAAEPRAALRAAMEAYIGFGLEQGGYYSIMFASDYPECKPYVEPQEQAVAGEATRISMEVLGVLYGALMQCEKVDEPQQRIAAAWAMLHGFVALCRYGSIGSIVEDKDAVRERCIASALALLLS